MGCKIAPATYYEHRSHTPTAREVRDAELKPGQYSGPEGADPRHQVADAKGQVTKHWASIQPAGGGPCMSSGACRPTNGMMNASTSLPMRIMPEPTTARTNPVTPSRHRGYDGEFQALRDREQAAVDHFVSWRPVEHERNVQAVAVDVRQPSGHCHGLARLIRIISLLDAPTEQT